VNFESTKVDGINRVWSGGGAWADCKSDTHVGRSSANGIRYNGGTRSMNRSSDNEVYSFH
jgi:hypothetical protein